MIEPYAVVTVTLTGTVMEIGEDEAIGGEYAIVEFMDDDGNHLGLLDIPVARLTQDAA